MVQYFLSCRELSQKPADRNTCNLICCVIVWDKDSVSQMIKKPTRNTSLSVYQDWFDLILRIDKNQHVEIINIDSLNNFNML